MMQRIQAHIIVDFNNPVSVDYMETSIKSFTPVQDIIEITPIQCITPKTLTPDIDWGNQRAPTESACLNSQYLLWKRLAEGEKFIIMEHDAYLFPVPQKIKLFRHRITQLDTFDVMLPGIAMEFYTMSQQVAKNACELVEQNHPRRGPMAIVHRATDSIEGDKKVMWPVGIQQGIHDPDLLNKTCISNTCSNALAGKGKVFDASVTQLIDLTKGGTVHHKNWDLSEFVTKKTHPNFHFID